MSIVLAFATFFLILVALALILVVLMQKAKSDGGMGAAMGGGMAEAAFGAETGNVLSKFTINAAIAFFVLTFALYLGRVYQSNRAKAAAGSALPDITAPAKPVTTAPLTAPTAMPTAPAANTTAPTTGPSAPVAPAADPKKP